jgi:uncharacterized LabA/DUF88 family protein
VSLIENHKLAVLIDADNAQAAIAAELLAEIAKYGIASVKRAYGDWTTSRLNGWKDHLHKHAIQPMQQFSYTQGKNSTDSSLIIDAMDLLHTARFDGFCLVSSDSDFTRLATRLRESGMTVYGFGEKKTPISFISACDKFIQTEILRTQFQLVSDGDDVENRETLKDILTTSINAISRDDEDGWVTLSGVGGYISKNHSSFDSRNYGCLKLGELVHKQSFIEVKAVPDHSNKIHIYVRLKNQATLENQNEFIEKVL